MHDTLFGGKRLGKTMQKLHQDIESFLTPEEQTEAEESKLHAHC